PSKVTYYPKGLPQPGAGSEAEERRVRLGAGNRPQLGGRGFGRAGFGGASPGAGLGSPAAMAGGRGAAANPDDVMMIESTNFVVQFHWTPIPKEERVDQTAEGDAAAEDAAGT